jgi:hypothetical protein
VSRLSTFEAGAEAPDERCGLDVAPRALPAEDGLAAPEG